MKMFLASLASVLILAVGAMYSFDTVLQRRADQAFVSPTSVRIPSHGMTHNLVGITWYSAADHVEVDAQ